MTNSKTWLALLGLAPVFFLLWHHQPAPCQKPLAYRIGRFDPQFGIRQTAFRSIIEQAENLWEASVGKNLFAYDPAADFTINLVFDQRQQATVSRRNLVRKLQAIESSHTNLATSFDQWHDLFKEKKAAYQLALASYQARLNRYNDNVRYWNDRGGAPAEMFRKLERARQRLRLDKDRLNADHDDLTDLLERLKTMQAQGETLASTYQSQKRTYQARFAKPSRFNQGEYDGKGITVYQFNDPHDLTLLLAHELGHALGLSHVDDPKAVMYYLKGGQDRTQAALTRHDIEALKAACRLD